MARGECREFTYGGCVGNHNNFPTEEGKISHQFFLKVFLYSGLCLECRSYCARHIKPYSGGLEKPDLNRHQIPNPHAGGNHGHHTTAMPPLATWTTSHRVHPIPKAYSPPLVPLAKPTSPLPDLCRQQKDGGNCFGEALHFYYDWDKGKCAPFSYTGCGGNTNRFQSEETCERACGLYRDQGLCLFSIFREKL